MLSAYNGIALPALDSGCGVLKQWAMFSRPVADGVPRVPDAEAASSPADHQEAASPLLGGAVVAAKYRLEQQLGEGGMGVVWLGRHIELDQPVAIKFLRPRVARDARVVARFLTEARAAAAMRSEHVVRVMDFGQLESGQPYMVMELLEGIDLGALLRAEGPLSVDRALDYVLQACSALVDAHAEGIIHRDIKPENLFLTRGPKRETIKLVDFGLAKRLDVEPEQKLTGPQDYMGSPGYMSPEQMTAPHEVDARTDIWSMGIVLYQLLTGKLPFDGRTVVEVCAQVLHATPQSISEFRADAGADLNAIIFRCLEKRPDERYPSVAEFVAELERYRSAAIHDTQSMRSVGTVKDAASDEAEDVELKLPVRSVSVVKVALLSIACGAAGTYAANRMGWFQLGGTPAGTLAPARDQVPDKPIEAQVDTPPEPRARDDAEGGPAASDLGATEGAAAPGAGKAPAEDKGVESEKTPSESAADRAQKAPKEAPEALTAAEKERRYRDYLREQGLRPLREVLAEEQGTTPPAPNVKTRGDETRTSGPESPY